ncbi:STAS domain-containing protein [Streptomyces sp. NPDC053474]|uniref:STAS domain-containing protein n=1 Tax=Streptomyces sp. NPDC053474 TaxID=3365704 RepID=UPI0037D5A140
MSSPDPAGPSYVAASDETPANQMVITGPVRKDDIPALCAEFDRRAGPGQGPVVCDLRGVTTADLATVEAVARLRLAARRAGVGLRLRGPTPALWALLRLVGLAELCVEVEGHPEQREPPLGVEEAVESGDPAR